ncbi:MAG: glycosyltransferase [Parcubacteria group bacterium]
MKLTICICTHNRIDFLRRCLESIKTCLHATAREKMADIALLVVANSCTDGSVKFLQKYLPDFPCAARYVEEGRTGLSIARNRGITEANSEYIAYFDDDGLVASDWVEAFFQINQKFPGAVAYGGPMEAIIGELNKLPKSWAGMFIRYEKYPEGRYPDPWNNYPVGCNCVVNIQAARTVGGYNEKMGRRGNQPFDYDEIEFYHRLIRANLSNFVYAPQMIFYHGPRSSELSIWRAMRGMFFTGRSAYLYKTFDDQEAGELVARFERCAKDWVIFLTCLIRLFYSRINLMDKYFDALAGTIILIGEFWARWDLRETVAARDKKTEGNQEGVQYQHGAPTKTRDIVTLNQSVESVAGLILCIPALIILPIILFFRVRFVRNKIITIET